MKDKFEPKNISYNKDFIEPVEIRDTKDSPSRSLLKALSYRLLATIITFIISFIIFRSYTEKTIDESLGNASLIAIMEFVAKLLFYYLHERLWTNIRWGKYWRRKYWKRRAWKKLYKKLHKD
ncbi:MAG: DUF2061 domain-containing protein [Bacteroidales bacterium]|nr:DUF2061 domain-containing protein [Bacteroidales bacterium]